MRNAQDMKPLKNHLDMLGYQSILVDLPLTFHPIERSVELLDDLLADMLTNLGRQEKIHLVGHSTGGLVIRSWLAGSGYSDKVDKCVQLATPNKGSELADLAGKFFNILPALFKTLKSLQSQQVKKLPTPDQLPVAIGAIAGNKNNLLLGRLLKGENDGRVTVESVRMAGLKDFLVLPLGHLEIHQQLITARYVDRFLRQGSFN